MTKHTVSIGCVSKDFKPYGYAEYSIGKLMLLGKIPKLYYGNIENYYTLCKYMESIGVDMSRHLDRMIIFGSNCLRNIPLICLCLLHFYVLPLIEC